MAHVEVVNGESILRDDWCVEDILMQCDWLTEDQAEDVLQALADNFDANFGINWEVIEITAQNLYPNEDIDYDDDDEEEEF